MAPIGSKFSYAQVEAPKDSIQESMQYVNELDYRAKQDRLKAEEAKAKAQKEKDDAMATDLEKIKAISVGKRGYDAPVIEAANLLRKQYADNYRDLNSGKLSKTEFEIKKNNIFSQVDLMKQKSQSIIDKTKTLSEMLKDGKLEDGFEDKALKLGKSIDNGHIYTELDSDGNVNMIAYDVDENGNKTIIEKSSLADFGNSSLNPVTKVNYQKEIEEFKKNNALGLIESLGTNIKTGVKELKKGSNIDKNIEAFAEAKVSDPNALSVAYRNATGNFETDIKDPEKIKIAKDWIYNQTFNSYAKEINVDEATQRANLSLQRQKYADEKKKEEIQKIQAVFDKQLTHDDFTNRTLSPNAVNPNMIGFEDKKITFSNLGGAKSGLNNGYITGFVLQKDGKVIVTGKALKDKGQKFKAGGKEMNIAEAFSQMNSDSTPQSVKDELQPQLDSYSISANYGNFIREVSGPELAGFARIAGYDSPNEVKSELKRLNPQGKSEETKEERLARMKAELNK